MKNKFNIFVIHVITFFVFFGFIFLEQNKIHSYASVTTMSLDFALWNSYQIGSEYFCGKAARGLNNAPYTDIQDIAGLNNPFTVSQDYGQIAWDFFTDSAPTYSQSSVLNEIYSQSQDIDPTLLSDEDQAMLKTLYGITDLHGMKLRDNTIGKFDFFYLVNEVGEWVGSTFDHILFKIQSLSAEEVEEIQEATASSYPYDSRIIYSDNFSTTVTLTNNNVGSGKGSVLRYVIQLERPVYFYSDPIDDYDHYKLHMLWPLSVDDSVSCTYASRYTIKGPGNYPTLNVANPSYASSATQITINGVKYLHRFFNIYFGSGTHQGLYVNSSYCDFFVCSYDDLVTYLTENDSLETVQAEIVDTESVPYVVPDVGAVATPISDVYPVVDNLREGVLTVPAADSLALGKVVTGSLADAIDQAITDAQARSIAIPVSLTPDPPEPEPEPDLPDWFWPSFIPDLLPRKIFEMFQPIFDMVGVSYSSYNIWLLIPAILIAVLIFYIIISVL